MLNCALTVYRRALWTDRTALDYVRRRAVPDWVLRECAVGYADGYSLEAEALRRRSLLDVAEALGLFRRLPGRGRQVSGDDGTTGVDIASPSRVERGPCSRRSPGAWSCRAAGGPGVGSSGAA